VRLETGSDRAQFLGLERGESAEREVRHVGDALRGEGVDQVVVVPVGEVVEVLHTYDRRD
jgi:sirohydrochlorin ferrochelatase